ncbi:DEAD/DEAH box helicase [Erythrobacter sp.]|uniref:DEAD/DEAH box helicase n=1 Tax=Erythrobacter sp. TaxID=1042 RepID=UPI001425E7C5|nr:DEAD/DEAH box helicase [Erythrobacter sp.]QIQ86352.1 MAG: DEAD/DEAH box helicase [Erythrobacter sp.]
MQFPLLPASLAAALVARGYTSATPVQAEVLAPAAAGRDLVVSAQTGSGKTIAFGLAIAAQMLGRDDCLPPPCAPLALVIAPTRELALQVSRELGWLYAEAGGRIATCVGGMNPRAERDALRAGAHVVVGTPGRLRDHLERGALDLAKVRAVVLDEADEMLDMGFREELEAILDAAPEERRTLLFSATMPRPIEALAKRYQHDAVRIATAGDDRGHGDIAYEAVCVPSREVENAAINLLRFHEAETAILFCATREKVRQLHAALQERGFAAVALSGEHSQSERNQALAALREGRARVCVATDVAARGIDLPTLSLVIHAEIPRDAETLQHRSGRTGRAGRKGTAVLLVPPARRKRVEAMLRHAQVAARWSAVPDRAAIRAKDHARLLADLLLPVKIDEDDRALAERLLAERSPAEIAALLVRTRRARLPEPADIVAMPSPSPRGEGSRPGFEDIVWFRMDIGRRDNAEARWILPLICRRGQVTRSEVGAIRIGQDETFFQVPRAIADAFATSIGRTARGDREDEAIAIRRSETGPPEMPRGHRASARKFVKPKPGGKGPAARRPKSAADTRPKRREAKPHSARRKQR